LKSVCVFCGSRLGSRPEYAVAAREVGEWIARRGWRLVYGGGNVGLMGVCADAAIAAGGEVIGVMPQFMTSREIQHKGLSAMHVVRDMSERKCKMFQLSDMFLALPGGYGTLDELFEAMTLTQIGRHAKPCYLLNTAGYYDALLQFIADTHVGGFVPASHAQLLQVGSTISEIEQLLTSQI